MRRRFVISCLLMAVVSGAPPLVAEDGFSQDAQPFLEFYCQECHDEASKKGQVRLDGLGAYRDGHEQLWTRVHEQVRSGEMPPEDKAQPTAAERTRFLEWIASQARTQVQTGAGSTRRLNRREFSAALQDLVGLPIDFGAGLPEDGKVERILKGSQASIRGMVVGPDGGWVAAGTKDAILVWKLDD
jgi:hypothetical protein